MKSLKTSVFVVDLTTCIKSIFIVIALSLLLGCSDGGTSESNQVSLTTDDTITGQFIDGPVSGLSYLCSSGNTGTTNHDGRFTCKKGDTVTFQVGNVILGSTTADTIVTPVSLFPDNFYAATNIAQLLQTLDDDGDLTTFVIDGTKAERLHASLDVTSDSFDTDAASMLLEPLKDASSAVAHLNESISLVPGDRNYPLIVVTDPVVTELVTDPEPVVIDPELVVIDPEPVVTDPEPVVTDPEPVVTDPEPVVTDPEPVVTNPEAVLSEPISENDLAYSAPVSDIVQSVMDSPLVHMKEGVWANGDNLKATMWSEHVQLEAGVHEYYVSPNGLSTNRGTSDSPWSLTYALHLTNGLPGNSIIWLKEGDYVNPKSTSSEIVEFVVWLEGEPGKPIHIRPEYGAHVRIDAGLTILSYSKHIRIWDIHMTTIGEDWRTFVLPQGEDLVAWTGAQGTPVRLSGGLEGGDDIKYINTTMSHLSGGASIWKKAANAELYGSLIFNNGWTWIDSNGNLAGGGPGMYIQNSSGTMRTISDNIVAGWMSTGIQIKPDDLEISDHFTVTGNVWFAPSIKDYGRGYLSVGVNGSKDLHFNKNFTHGTQVYMPGIWGETYVQTDEHQCNDNYFYRTDTDPAFTCDYGINEDVSDPNETGNTLTKSFIRPNKYDPRRANLMVLNGERKSELSVDLGTFVQAGEKVVVLNSLDPYGEPIAAGVYNGTYFNIKWPTSDWEIEPVSSTLTKDLNTVDNEFWAFVVVKVD